MTSPDGKIRIPLNESQDDHSQIEEFLKDYRGEGIQHIALATDDIFGTVEAMREAGVAFQDTPDTYYEQLDGRVPGHGESLQRLRADRILIDGAPTEGQGLLLQIFTENRSGRSSSRSSSARATRASARATSRRCSSRSSSTRSAAACCRRRRPEA